MPNCPATTAPKAIITPTAGCSSLVTPPSDIIASKIGNVTRILPEDGRNQPRIRQAARYIKTVFHGDLRENLFVIIMMAMRRAKPLFVRHAASMKHKSIKTAVSLPKEFCVTHLKPPSSPSVINAMRISRLVQFTPTVSQRMIAPTRMPSTPAPVAGSPGTGMNREKNISTIEITSAIICEVGRLKPIFRLLIRILLYPIRSIFRYLHSFMRCS